ncbi:hypothetical protein BDQ17DRAFT_1367886 [Cyathus striatus]|nr:hypothetical protein BDQ17DRAFT_1367886 [Cyathus striatus]
MAPTATTTIVVATPLEERADKWCTLWGSSDNVNCRSGTSTSYNVVRIIHNGERFGVRCTRRGQTISGNDVWDYIPGWGCYVSAHYTNDGCESGVPAC